MNCSIKLSFFFYFLFFTFYFSNAQPFTHADTLRGSNGSGRNWWDVMKYDLHVKFNIDDSSIIGSNIISYKVLKMGKSMQIDLQQPLVLDSIVTSVAVNDYKRNGTQSMTRVASPVVITNFRRDGNAWFFDANEVPIDRSINELTVYYHGKPNIAKFPPWDGGVVWKKDKANNPWVSIACQGTGASIWYPCKDIQSDEPDSAEMHITVPDSLICIGNGRLRGKAVNENGTTTWDWAVVNPLNSYNLIPYIGKYVHFSEIYKGEDGNLDLDYWVLDSNLLKAKTQFRDVPKMMKAFEYWFGPYPFYKDGYKLVEAPYLGMEHQSAIAYGNEFGNGYLGKDLSGSGWGLKWDYIIVHESGHEWFGNNITTKDIADMWVHEGFTNYSEMLFVEYYYGKTAADEYITGIKKKIQNIAPITGTYGVNKEGSIDMYFKAANMIHTIRQVINNDVLFRKILRGLNKTFYHQTVTSAQVENYINTQSKINFSKFFEQYLLTTQIPVLEYKLNDHSIQYRYTNCIKNFILPLKIKLGNQQSETRWIKPTSSWQPMQVADWHDGRAFTVDPNFYINTKKSE